jgi:hypothetical protein
VFVNALICKDNLSDEEQEIFLQLLNGLTVRHIKIMAILHLHNTGDLIDVVQQQYAAYDKDNIYYIMDDLRNKGLVHEKGAIYDTSLSTNFNQLSEMGNKFVNFISL